MTGVTLSLFLLCTTLRLSAAEDPWSLVDEVYSSPGLDLYVPPNRSTELGPVIARLQADWDRWEHAMQVPATGRAVLWFNDDDDGAGQLDDGGYGRFASVGVVADPWGPGGRDQVLLRARRQLARMHLTQRIPGWRGRLARVLGEQTPADPLSLLSTLIVLPAADSFPSWWTEALLAWQAREDGDVRPNTWRTLARTVWRLEADATPDPGQWRTAVAEWPYTLRASAYGLAYGEALAARFPGRLTEVARDHLVQPPFWFAEAPTALLGVGHDALLAEVAGQVSTTQQRDVAAIRAAGVRAPERRTPAGIQVREATWLVDGTLLVREDDVLLGTRRLTIRDANGQRRDDWFTTLWMDDDARDLRRASASAARPTGTLSAMDVHGRTRARMIGGPSELRLRHGIALTDGTVLGIEMLAQGGQRLIHARADGTMLTVAPTPADALPWSPAIAPDGQRVAWIERSADGSRLMEADLPGFTALRVRWTVAGVMLLPQYMTDGLAIVLSSDHTGVANAWRVDQDGMASAITNTLGGVLACLPAADGSCYAIIDHDRDGAFLGFLPVSGDAAPPLLAELPSGGSSSGTGTVLAVPLHPAKRGDGFHDAGLRAVMPTTSPSRIGPSSQLGTSDDIGVQVVSGDPLWRSRLILGAGAGHGGHPVGALRYASLHLAPLELAVGVYRHEDLYEDMLTIPQGRTNYEDTVSGGRLSASLVETIGIHVGVERHASNQNALPPMDPSPFAGNERYVEATARVDTRSEHDLSPGPESGLATTLEARHSGLGGDLERNRVVLGLEGTLSVWPAAGHQVVARTVVGWSDGDDPLQGSFAVGGHTINSTAILRGYGDVQAVGAHLAGWSLAYRLPLWRPRFGSGTQPWYIRQLVLEPFVDAAKTTPDQGSGMGRWYRSLGTEVHVDVDLWIMRLRPGVVFAQQLDGPKDIEFAFTIGNGINL